MDKAATSILQKKMLQSTHYYEKFNCQQEVPTKKQEKKFEHLIQVARLDTQSTYIMDLITLT